jgi:hypothetical protein
LQLGKKDRVFNVKSRAAVFYALNFVLLFVSFRVFRGSSLYVGNKDDPRNTRTITNSAQEKLSFDTSKSVMIFGFEFVARYSENGWQCLQMTKRKPERGVAFCSYSQ